MDKASEVLPQIRQDLAIEPAGPGWNGEPSWLIHDSLQNRFFRISDKTMQLLGIWQAVEVEELVSGTSSEFSKQDVLEVARFLYANSLATTAVNGDYKNLFARSLAGKKSWWKTIIHSYLFFKIPLARPQRFLDFSWPLVKVLFTRGAVAIYVAVAIIGLYLVSRQWTLFLTTFTSFLTVKGFMLYAMSLVFIKIMHELGHAFMAKRNGVEVPTIGAAFIVLMPILYTDTSAAWRLSDKKQRLMVDFAGIFTELVLAGLCTIAWVFLPDGNLRAIAFTTATLSWVLSLTINLNPFMKFDGYYILSDMLGFENLQERGFALAKWSLREMLFGLKIPAPEILPPRLHKFVIIHAFGVWIYRFFLFLGIALLVYHFFFKVLGIVMFIIEMAWFIAMPITNELKEWWKMKDEIRQNNRYRWPLAAVVILLAFMVYPFSNSVSLPAILSQHSEAEIHATFPAQIVQVLMHEGMEVQKGQLLIRLQSRELDQEISNTRLQLASINARLLRAHADQQDRSLMQVLASQKRAVSNKLAGLKKKLDELDIRAPHEGIVVDVENALHTKRWINQRTLLAIIRSAGQLEFKMLADEKSRQRLQANAHGRFIPDDLQRPSIAVKVTHMANIAGTGSEVNYLSEEAGSLIAMQRDKNGRSQTRKSWFALRARSEKAQESPDTVLRGIMVLDADPQSLISQIARQVASVLVREAGI